MCIRDSLYKQSVESLTSWAESTLEKFGRNTVGAWSTAVLIDGADNLIERQAQQMHII